MTIQPRNATNTPLEQLPVLQPGDEIVVPVPGGHLVLGATTDTHDPGAYIEFRPNGMDTHIDLFLAECQGDDLRPKENDKEDLFCKVWSDPLTEDYTDDFIIRRKTLENAPCFSE